MISSLVLHHIVTRVPEDPVDGGHGGDGGGVTHAVGQQLLPDLPGEHAGVVCLDADDPLHNRGSGYLLQTKLDMKRFKIQIDFVIASFAEP